VDTGVAGHITDMNTPSSPVPGAVGEIAGAVHTFGMNTKSTPGDLLWANTVDGRTADLPNTSPA